MQNEKGQIVWHKSFYDQRKKPYANKGVQLYNKSLEGGVSSIIRTEYSPSTAGYSNLLTSYDDIVYSHFVI